MMTDRNTLLLVHMTDCFLWGLAGFFIGQLPG